MLTYITIVLGKTAGVLSGPVILFTMRYVLSVIGAVYKLLSSVIVYAVKKSV